MTGRKERQYKCPLIKVIAGALPVYKMQTANPTIQKLQPSTLCVKFRPTPRSEKKLLAMLPNHKQPTHQLLVCCLVVSMSVVGNGQTVSVTKISSGQQKICDF